MDPTTLEIHTRRLKAYKDENGSSADGGEVQTDLFGNDDSAMIEMVKISKAAGELVKENRQKILAVKGVVKRPQVASQMGVDINDPEAVKAAIARLEYENQRLMSPTPEPEILHKIKVRAGLETEESQVVETDEAAAMQDDSLDLGLAASGGMEVGDRFGKIKKELNIDKDSNPNLLDSSGTDTERMKRAEKEFNSWPTFTRAADGVKIKLKVSEGGSLIARIIHMISNNEVGGIHADKLAWLSNVRSTIENAQVRLKGRYDARKQKRT